LTTLPRDAHNERFRPMQDLTTGSLSAHLMKTTSFMLVGMVFQTLYVLVDMYWVGRLGTEAVAAVGLSANLTFIVLAATQMLGVGTTALVSHAIGRKDRERANLVFNQSQVLATVVGVIFFILAMALRRSYAHAFGADPETELQAANYLGWFIPAMAAQFGLVAMGAALRGTGNFRPGMVVQAGTVVLNMILAPFLVFGWGTGVAFGVAGAALATFIAVIVGVIGMTYYFSPARSALTFIPADWRPRMGLWRDILKIGLPAGAEFALTAVYLAVVYTVSKPFGAAAQAGFGVGLRIVQACFLPVVALGFAVAPVAGQNFGARQADRVKKTFRTAALLAAVGMGIVAVALQFSAEAFIGVFSHDPQVLAVGSEYLRIVAWNFIASGIIFVTSSMFQAMGNSMPSLVTSFTRIALVSIPTLMLSHQPGFRLLWVWYLSAATVTLQLVMNLLWLRREFARRLDFPSPVPAVADTPPGRAVASRSTLPM
jgi:putative MATE family efflux protein